MANDLLFPRLIYRGLPDTLGMGTHTNDEGKLVGETKRVDSQDDLDAAIKDGWRLTRDDPAQVKADARAAAAEAKADAADAKAAAKDKK